MVYTTPTKSGRIVEQYRSGRSSRAVAKEFHVSPQTVCSLAKKFKENGNIYPLPKPGRPCKLTAQDADFAVLQLDRGRAENVADLQRSYFPNVGPKTLRRAMRTNGLISAVRRRVPFLTKKHRRARLIWARALQGWTEREWERIIFSDESKFNLIHSDGRAWCWRRVGDGYQDRYTQKTKKFGGGSVMVWGCITPEGVGRLHRITGIMRAVDYVQILEQDLLGTLHNYHMNPHHYFFQQDNDPKHSSHLRSWVDESGLHSLPWPAQSPDMNLIEHVWDILDRRVRARNPQPSSVDQLWDALEEEWSRISSAQVQKLYGSMPNRVAELKKAKGGNTRY
ncbi:hypothetical protein SCP_0602820 [Sparassis crispa]|uniref:Transposable element Tcb2 transposase n=1 Tax=Sparassis crispa TaxID=139825 RepID=A0A401GRF6_9APHY|nr:hypothetical protein SCP_0602820 [Sparassis crispa]GBE84304.1 hypothetical protein SCP_0602820 [Sparassis crispa]